MADTLGEFMNRVGKIPLLTPDEEILLSRHIQAWLPLRGMQNPTREERRIIRRGRRAYDRFFSANVKLAIYVAKKFSSKATSMTIDDLIQEGCIGLARGIEKFDPERGYKFSTYCFWWIRQSINRAIEVQDRMIRLPINSLQQMAKVRRFIFEYQAEHGCMPTQEQCAQVSGLSVETYKNCMRLAHDCHSLDALANVQLGSNLPLKELIADDRNSPMELAEMNQAKEALDKWQDILTDSERELIDARYGLSGQVPETLSEIGKKFKVSREMIRCKEQRAIRKLKYAAAA